MTPEQMQEALETKKRADTLRKQLEKYVLLKRVYNSPEEIIWVGEPDRFANDKFAGLKVQIPDSARRHVFNLWRREVALQYNACVRKLAQAGMTTDHELIDITTLTTGKVQT